VGPILIDTWLADCEPIAIRDEGSISQAREATRSHAAAAGLGELARERAAAAVSELARNQLRHATDGFVGFRTISRTGVPGLEIVAADRGPGIADPTKALAGAARLTGSLGVGISAAYRQVDEMDLDVRWGEGTCITARTFAAPVPRSELAVLSRPCAREPCSGDHAGIVRDDAGVTIAVADGLGHGVLARDASDRAIEEVGRHPGLGLDELLLLGNTALEGTRGAVMAVVRIDAARTTVAHAGVGNVTTRVIGVGGRVRTLPGTAGVLGAGLRFRRIQSERAALAADDLIVLATDGLATRASLGGDPAVLRRPPIVIAHQFVIEFGRADDDVLVVVAR